MPFNSLAFLYGFLPLALGAYFLVRRWNVRWALFILLQTSFVFYAWDYAWFLPVLVALTFVNYAMSSLMDNLLQKERVIPARRVMILGIVLNILFLLSLKYTDSANIFTNGSLSLRQISLPLGTSYISFSFISFFIELYKRRIQHPSLIDFFTFTFLFPKLSAGPITRGSEILPQISSSLSRKISIPLMQAIGFIAIGAFKKAVIADQLDLVVDPIFEAIGKGIMLSPFRAWFGTTAYGLQLYFDFSGYSDMAIGIALLFGFRLPINFNAPYRAVNISDFWRRWHITLSNFFRDYVYIPLGGNRKGFSRELCNLMIIMILCGMWHGSGWTYVLWGAMHGLYMIIHRYWKIFQAKRDMPVASVSRTTILLNQFITFFAVTIAWVPFRSDSLGTALRYYTTMFSTPNRMPNAMELFLVAIAIVIPLLIIWCLPTSQNWLGYENASPKEATKTPLQISQPPFSPSVPIQSTIKIEANTDSPRQRFIRGFLTGCIAVAALSMISQPSEFIYMAF